MVFRAVVATADLGRQGELKGSKPARGWVRSNHWAEPLQGGVRRGLRGTWVWQTNHSPRRKSCCPYSMKAEPAAQKSPRCPFPNCRFQPSIPTSHHCSNCCSHRGIRHIRMRGPNHCPSTGCCHSHREMRPSRCSSHCPSRCSTRCSRGCPRYSCQEIPCRSKPMASCPNFRSCCIRPLRCRHPSQSWASSACHSSNGSRGRDRSNRPRLAQIGCPANRLHQGRPVPRQTPCTPHPW